MAHLRIKQIKRRLKTLPCWSKQAGTISRTYKFEGFLDGIYFVGLIAREAEQSNHHPDIDIRWNQVKLTLTTHDEGGITGKDFLLAKQCDRVFDEFPPSPGKRP
ncbi:MAG: pterin-4-alpha-carbinolamine dehydratase [Pedosphaera sp.]|nr:pterin-4-alpha-carbinolamine dehydratase [Pedosphaera sp.]